MKLSEIKGERALDVIADLIDPICAIAEDPEAGELFSRKAVPDGMTTRSFMLRRVRKSVPKLMKDHRANLVTILSTLDCKTYQEYVEAMSIPKIVTDVFSILTDDAFGDLFISAQSGDSSGSVPENTAAHEA